MTAPLRAALYLRVSTVRQAEHDVSIPDQRRQGEAWCAARGYRLVETYVEPGASAANDRRPEFQRMIEAGTSKPAPFDVVKDRIVRLKAIRDQAKADAERAQAMLQNAGSKAVTPEMLSKFAEAARQRIRLEGGAIAATISARSPSASRLPRARFGSWDQNPGCFRRWYRTMA